MMMRQNFLVAKSTEPIEFWWQRQRQVLILFRQMVIILYEYSLRDMSFPAEFMAEDDR